MKGVLIVLGCVVGIAILLILGYLVYFLMAMLAPAIAGAWVILCIAVLLMAYLEDRR